MEKLKCISIVVLTALVAVSCDDMLNVEPKGVVTEEQVSQPESIDGLVTAAYASLQKMPPCCAEMLSLNPWIASVRSDDAYKGGGGLDDQGAWYQMEVFSLVSSSVGNNNGMWKNGYRIISRTNEAISKIQQVDEADFPMKTTRLAEMRFLRGWAHYEMKIRYKWIPYIPEGLSQEEMEQIPNRPENANSDLPIWEKIYEDFIFAAENLPETMGDDEGRISKYGAEAYLVETLLWMAYEQDENNQVININNARLEEALTHANNIIESGMYRLASDFATNFMYATNTSEALWELQFSVDDGTPDGNLNEGNSLTSPWWAPYFSCCDFHKPSFNMVNAFKVDENGIPMFETFNEESAQNNYGPFFSNNTFDPRIGHTVAVPGLPWKYQNEAGNQILYDSSGTRQSAVYGYFHSLKENVRTDSPGLVDLFWMHNSKDQAEVRYDEVLLWKAEILIELGRHNEALPIINQIRNRAANSTGKLTFHNGNPTLNYNVEPYRDGENINWTQETAREALRWERRLELAMEGRRFFDLVRWGIAAEVMNAYFEKEGQRRQWLEVANFTAGRDEFRPIPQEQINLAEGVYQQNPGY